MNIPAELPFNDELDDFLDELPPPESQSLFNNDEPTESQMIFNEIQELATPTQNLLAPLRKTQLQNEFQQYKNFNKLTYQQCKYRSIAIDRRIDPFLTTYNSFYYEFTN